jgi:hypothetical protein
MSGIERLRAIRAKYATDTPQSQSNDADGTRGRARKRATDKVDVETSPATTKASNTIETRKHVKKSAADGAEANSALTAKESTSDATPRKHEQRSDEESNDNRTFQDLVQEYGNDGKWELDPRHFCRSRDTTQDGRLPVCGAQSQRAVPRKTR